MSGICAMCKPLLSQETLKGCLEYDPMSGDFYWKISRGKASAGCKAGYISNAGYRVIRVNGINYLAHRLAYLYMTGENPSLDIDHKDMVRCNNKWQNLRLAHDTENHWNVGLNKNNKSGYKGVSFDANSGKYKASIRINKTRIYLGTHETAELAHQAYQAVAIKHHGEFFRDYIS